MDGKNDKINNNFIFTEMIKKQRKNIPENKKLSLHDIKRICKNLNQSIFTDKCSLWSGYVTNKNKTNKGTYVNFYFRHKKVALHRLLYINYNDDLSDSEYLKYTCCNKGVCCNINHLRKFKYNKKNNKKQINKVDIKDEPKKSEKKVKKDLIVDFD